MQGEDVDFRKFGGKGPRPRISRLNVTNQGRGALPPQETMIMRGATMVLEELEGMTHLLALYIDLAVVTVAPNCWVVYVGCVWR